MNWKQLAAWCFVAAVCGMLVGAMLLAVWSRRVEYSATVSVWGGVRSPGKMLYDVVSDERRLQSEFRKRKYLEEVAGRLDWERRRGISLERAVRDLEEAVDVRWADGGWVKGWGAIEVTAWQSSEDEAREVARTLADVFWETTVAKHLVKARAEFEAADEELRRTEAQLEEWMAQMRELLPEEDGSRRFFAPESNRSYSSYLDVLEAYQKATGSLHSLKLQQITRRISLMRPRQSFDLPGMIEMGERPVKRNAWTWLLGGVLAGGGIGAGSYIVSTTLSKLCRGG